MKTRSKLFGTLLFAALAIPVQSFGHARFRVGTIALRNMSAGNKVGPCGSVQRNATPTVLTAGQNLVLQWEETINHPGYYRIAFSPAGDAGFEQNIIMNNIIDVQNNNVLPHLYQQAITVPNTLGPGTLQLIQYMTETNPPELYFSCADIVIQSAAGPGPSPTPAPTTPPPGESCD